MDRKPLKRNERCAVAHKDKADSMTLLAGHELDLLVAEKVMGFRWFHCVAGTGVIRNQFCSKAQEETWCGVGWKMTPIDRPIMGEFNDSSGCPKYSTDIAATMEVVEKLSLEFSLGWLPSDDSGINWDASFGQDRDSEGGTCVYAETAPLAICRAALVLAIRGGRESEQ